jgi:hypothetical protein
MSLSTIFTGTDGTISVSGLVLLPAGTPVTGATALGTLRDAQGNVVSGWDGIALQDQGGGTYTAAFPASIVPAVGYYEFTVVLTKSGLTLTVERDIQVEENEV